MQWFPSLMRLFCFVLFSLVLVGKLTNSGLGRQEGGRANSKYKSRRIPSLLPYKKCLFASGLLYRTEKAT